MAIKTEAIDKSRPRGEATKMPTETIRDLADQVAAKENFRPKDDTKVSTTIRLDAEVLKFFKAGGMGWQTRINAILKNHVAQQIRG